MHELPFFFGETERQLFGIFHHPHIKSRETAFVFCHPFAEEKLWAHRVYVSLARQLAKSGYPVMRFDFMGHGDSMGDFGEADVETRLADIAIAIKKVFSQVGKASSIALFGNRFGATLAALAAERYPEVQCLIMWEPIVDGRRYMQEILRSNLSTQLTAFGQVKYNRNELVKQINAGKSVDVDGYPLTGKMFYQAEQINLEQRILKRSIPALVLQIRPKDNAPENAKFRSLASQYNPGNFELVREQLFWREIRNWYGSAPNAQESTLKWVKENCG